MRDALDRFEPTETPRIVVLEGREALREVLPAALEESMHAINSFVRSDAGRKTLVVWPTNTEELTDALVSLGENLGAEALFGTRYEVETFVGPPEHEYVGIAGRTIAALNEGASLTALGLSEAEARIIAEAADTIGRYLAEVREALIRNGAQVAELLAAERCRVWTVVISGLEAEADVAALTRGGFASSDIDRLITATEANVVKQLGERPEILGILGTVLDSRIIYLDNSTALAVAREFGDDELHALMEAEGIDVAGDGKALARLERSELGLLLSGRAMGMRQPGRKPGVETQAAFEALTRIASRNDAALNRALGRALAESGLIADFETERDLSIGEGLVQRSDLYCDVGTAGPIRLEIMWRAESGRAGVAKYVLTKLDGYGRAIGLI